MPAHGPRLVYPREQALPAVCRSQISLVLRLGVPRWAAGGGSRCGPPPRTWRRDWGSRGALCT